MNSEMESLIPVGMSLIFFAFVAFVSVEYSNYIKENYDNYCSEVYYAMVRFGDDFYVGDNLKDARLLAGSYPIYKTKECRLVEKLRGRE